MQVVVPYGAANASVRARALHWLERYASDRGVEVASVAEVDGPGFAGRARSRAVPTLVVRNAHRFSRGRRETRLLRAGAPGVYDLDDGLPWDDGRLPGLGRWWKRPWPRSLIAERSAAAADRVVVGNELLADWASSRCADVRVIPTCVEPDAYLAKQAYAVSDPPLLGWVGSPPTERYLVAIAPALAEVHRRTGARLCMVSAPGPVPRELAGFTDRWPWSEAFVAGVLATWDVGLMPLLDGVYERAKCGYKLLQYASAGLPAVGSPVGVNRRLLDGMRGGVAENVDDWVEVLCALLAEPSGERAGRGRAGRELATSYSYSAWEQRWRDAVGLGDGG